MLSNGDQSNTVDRVLLMLLTELDDVTVSIATPLQNHGAGAKFSPTKISHHIPCTTNMEQLFSVGKQYGEINVSNGVQNLNCHLKCLFKKYQYI